MSAIRLEQPGDEAAIFAVTEAAFTDHPHANGTEPSIVDALRSDGDLLASLVAVEGGEIVGHVAFSPATLSNGSAGWWVLGPISVAPARQGAGICRQLVEQGARHAQTSGARGIILVGSVALYSRFGFVTDTPITIDGPLAPHLQVLAFDDEIPAASVSFARAFNQTSP